MEGWPLSSQRPSFARRRTVTRSLTLSRSDEDLAKARLSLAVQLTPI
jgi:hypothetical protein